MIFSAALIALFTVNVQASYRYIPQANNKVGLTLGGQIWQSEAGGRLGEQNALADFNLKKEQQINFFVAIEHPFPLLPNVRISNTTLDATGKTTLTQAFSFGDETFPIGDDVNARFNVSYVDYTLYYPLFDTELFSFELGLSARSFNGAVIMTGAEIIEYEHDNIDYEQCHDPVHCELHSTSDIPTGKIKTEKIAPMLYIASNINLPLTGLNAFTQGNFLLQGDHSLYDYQVGLAYDLVDSLVINVNLTLGYRVVTIEFEDLKGLYTDLEFKGTFIGMMTHF